jgi:hypothetical protein
MAKFRICQCHVQKLFGSIASNLNKVMESKKIGERPSGRDDDVRYIG